MLVAIIFVSALFLLLPFIVTDKTAPYLLSGYNMLSKEEQQKFDIKSYLIVFRKFHWIMGAGFLVVGLSIYFFSTSTNTIMFLGIYPLAAYIIFFILTMKFFSGTLRTFMWVGIIVLTFSLVFVNYLFADGLSQSTLTIQNQSVVIEGRYGEIIPIAEIASIEMVDQLPKLSARTNGFSTGDVKKGNFKTSEGEAIKLFLHSRQTPILMITKESGLKIYYSVDESRNQTLFQELSGAFPTVVR